MTAAKGTLMTVHNRVLLPFQAHIVSQLLRVVDHLQSALLLGTLPGGLPAILVSPSISVYTDRYGALPCLPKTVDALTHIPSHPKDSLRAGEVLRSEPGVSV